MKIIEIGGWTYRVRFADEVVVDGPDGSIDANGSINGRRREIKLRRDQTVDSAIETVLHETSHAWRNHHAVPKDEECAAKDMASAVWTMHKWLVTEGIVEWLGRELGVNDIDPDSPVDWSKIEGRPVVPKDARPAWEVLRARPRARSLGLDRGSREGL